MHPLGKVEIEQSLGIRYFNKLMPALQATVFLLTFFIDCQHSFKNCIASSVLPLTNKVITVSIIAMYNHSIGLTSTSH